MDVGKLPNDLLQSLLAKVTSRDARVIVGPAVGRDAAVIDTGAPKLLVAKTDPVTLATDRIGWYAVQVNANDIACLGARPAWFLASVLLPSGAAPSLAESIFDQILEACRSLGVELVGGHTEITYRLDRPIVVGAMLGEVERERLVNPEAARPGDAVLLTKGIAIEGTAVLAHEARDRLRDAGVSSRALAAAANYLTEPGISVVPEAAAVCAALRPRAMHDPTEGGLATALHELAAACNAGVAVDAGAIEVLPETRTICEAAGLDPLGLLASGALLVVVPAADGQRAIEAIGRSGVVARRIATLVSPQEGVIMVANGERHPLPRFDRDEVARFLTA